MDTWKDYLYYHTGGSIMKHSLIIVLVASLTVSLTGCSYNYSSGGTKAAESSEETDEAQAAQATGMAATPSTTPEHVFRYGEVNGENNIVTQTGHKFAEYVNELSNGRIRIDIYPNHELGDERTSLRDLRRGGRNIDMYRGNTNALTGYGFKKLSLFGLPYIFENREGLWKVLEDQELGQAFLSEGTQVGANMVGLFYTDEGARNIFSTKKIRNIKDLKGMKLRVPESVLMMDTFSALQARPIPLPYGDVYEAIKSGVIEGGENPVTGYLSNELYEIAPYYLITEHVFSPGIVLMAEAKWNELSDEDKNILMEAGRKASAWNRSVIQQEEARIYEELEQKGVTITRLSSEDMEKAHKLEEIVRISFTPGLEDDLAKIIDIQK